MKRYFVIAATALSVLCSSCSDWLDINYDPNSPAEENVQTDMILPAVEAALGTTLGVNLNIIGGYQAEYYAHQFGISNYLDYSQFNVSSTNTSGAYTQLYQKVLVNCQTIQNKAQAEEDWGTNLAAATIRAYALQLLVDMYGAVPYTEALNTSILMPKFDEGEVVYEGVIAELDEALSKVSEGDAVATSLLLPGETAGAWIQFANAQKLKMLTRLANVKDVNAAIKALIDEGNFPTEDIALADCWSNASGQANPFYSEEFATWGRATHNIVANLALVNTMQPVDNEGAITYTDPRLAMLILPNSEGNYVGNISGTNHSTSEMPFGSTAYWCIPNVNYDSPIYLLTVAETEFFIAEYYAKAGNMSQAESAYNAALEASCATHGVDPTSVLSHYPFNASNWKQSVGVSKWLALAGVNHWEGYTEVRRLDYPAFGTVTAADMFNGTDLDVSAYQAGTLYTPYLYNTQVGKNHLLERLPFAEAAQSRNTNCPEYAGYTTPIFWGK